MGIRTEDFVPELPGKEMKPGVEWLDILDSFDPQSLDEKYLKECARRNPNETCYGYEPPHRPVEERLHLAEFCTESYRNELKTAVRRIEMEGLTSLSYQNARSTLIKAIGIKGATEVVRREYNRLGEDGRKKQAEEYAAWEKELDEKSARRDKIRAIAKEHPGFASDMACDSDYYILTLGVPFSLLSPSILELSRIFLLTRLLLSDTMMWTHTHTHEQVIWQSG